MSVEELYTIRTTSPRNTINMGIASGSVNIKGNLTVANNTTISSNLNISGNLSANYLRGDGYQITNLSISAGSNIFSGNSNVRVAANSNVTVSVRGIANVLTISNTGANISGTANITGNTAVGGNLTVTGNTNVSILGASGNITASYFLGNGSQLTGISTIGTGLVNGNSNVTVVANGNINFSATSTANVLTVASTVIVPAANVIPSAANTYTLGNSANRFNTVYANLAAIPGVPVQTIVTRLDSAVTVSAAAGNVGTEVTSLRCSITPKFSTSLILCKWVIFGEGASTHNWLWRVFKNGGIATGTYAGFNTGSGQQVWSGIAMALPYEADYASTPHQAVFYYHDFPASTNAVTYGPAIGESAGTAYTFYVNRTAGSTGAANYETGVSFAIVQEIAQ